jgi:mRNA-degrading endonuclease RelE of RelBE toxin-antitoxin system
VSELRRFRVVFEEEASEFVVAQSKRVRRKLLDITYAVAASPFAEPDYVLPDADGRNISHVATEGYVLSYWIDAPVKRVVVVEIERED